MKSFNSKDLISVIITVTVCIILIIIIVSPLITDTTFTDKKAELIVDMIQSMIALIAFRLGQQSVKNEK